MGRKARYGNGLCPRCGVKPTLRALGETDQGLCRPCKAADEKARRERVKKRLLQRADRWLRKLVKKAAQKP